MAILNDEYWKIRFEQLYEAQLSQEDEFLERIKDMYMEAISNIEKDITKWYMRLKINNDVSLRAAKMLLKNNELEEFKWTLKQYIKRAKENGIANDWTKQLENASAKFHISRLEAIKLQIQEHLEYLYGNYLDEMYEAMQDTYKDTYYKTAYELQTGFNMGFEVAQIDTKTLEKILAKPWAVDELNFSDRIWKDKNKLINTLQNTLVQSLIRGTPQDKVVKEFAKKMNVSLSQAGRLIATETAYFATIGEFDNLNNLGVKQYEILATLDRRTSDICRHLDGKMFNMSDFKTGITAPPFHCWCRSCIIPHTPKLKGSKRVARNDEGKTYYIDGNMKYNDWKEVFVDKTKTYKQWQDDNKNGTIRTEHKIVNGKNIAGQWKRRPNLFASEIDDIVNYQGFDGLPRLVNDKEEFLKLVDDDHFIGKRVYTAKTQKQLNEYANDLRYGKWYIDCHVGGSQFGQGMYCSSDYTKGHKLKDVNGIMDYYTNIGMLRGKSFSKIETITLDKSAKILYVPRERIFSNVGVYKAVAKVYVNNNPKEFGLSADFIKNVNKLNIEQQSEYEKICFAKAEEIFKKKINPSIIAVELGYDAIKVERRNGEMPHTVILNRTKVILFEGDLNE